MDACWAPVFCEYFKQSLDLSSSLSPLSDPITNHIDKPGCYLIGIQAELKNNEQAKL